MTINIVSFMRLCVGECMNDYGNNKNQPFGRPTLSLLKLKEKKMFVLSI